jgi:hypothetical protein
MGNPDAAIAVPATPPWLASLEPIADRSPIAVRQLRQQLRGRGWGVTLVALPALCLLAALLCFAAERGGTNFAGGITSARVLFSSYLLIWGLVCGAFQPGGAGRALRRERSEQTWDLIELAGLGGHAIAIGFWCAAMVQILLMSALFAPFLIMAWLLHGVDTGALLLALAVVPAWGALMAALAVFAASGPIPKKRKAGHLQLGVEVVALIFGVPVISLLLAGNGAARLGLPIGGGLVAGGIAISVWLVLVAGCLVHAGTALSHPARNRSTGPRLVSCLAALLTALWGAVLATANHHYLGIAAVLILGIAIWTGLGAIAEYDGTTPRQQRWIDSARGFWRRTAWFLAPGCRRGRRCVLLLTGLALLCAGCTGDWPIMRGCVGIVAYAFAFFVLADLVTRGLGSHDVHRPRVQMVVCIALVVATHVLGVALMWMNRSDAGGVALMLPLFAIVTLFDHGAASGLTVAVLVMAGLFTLILASQASRGERGTVRLVGDQPPER